MNYEFLDMWLYMFHENRGCKSDNTQYDGGSECPWLYDGFNDGGMSYWHYSFGKIKSAH